MSSMHIYAYIDPFQPLLAQTSPRPISTLFPFPPSSLFSSKVHGETCFGLPWPAGVDDPRGQGDQGVPIRHLGRGRCEHRFRRPR